MKHLELFETFTCPHCGKEIEDVKKRTRNKMDSIQYER